MDCSTFEIISPLFNTLLNYELLQHFHGSLTVDVRPWLIQAFHQSTHVLAVEVFRNQLSST